MQLTQPFATYTQHGGTVQQATITLSTYAAPKEVCELLNIDKATLYRWTKAGKFPKAVKIGRTVRYKAEEVKAFLDHCTETAEA